MRNGNNGARSDTKCRELTTRQARLLNELLAQPTMLKAAQNSGVPLRTARRWFAQDPVFRARYHEARRESVDAMIKYANAVGANAMSKTWKLACNEELPPHVRLGALKIIMHLGLHGFEKMDVTMRLEAVEAEQAGNRERRAAMKGSAR